MAKAAGLQHHHITSSEYSTTILVHERLRRRGCKRIFFSRDRNGQSNIVDCRRWDLFRITRAIRGESGTHSEDLFISRMDALCGFTHARFDWLDSTRYLWNFLAISGLVLTILAFENPSLIFYTNWFILMFAPAPSSRCCTGRSRTDYL